MKIKGLEEKIKDFKDRKNYLETTLDTLNNKIISLNKDIENKDGQIKKQTELIKNSLAFLEEQEKKIKEQEALLNKEKKDAQTQTDPYVDEHLKADIERLKKWNNDLYNNIYDLKNQAQSDKEIRDQELTNLRQQKTELEDKHNQFIANVIEKMEGEGQKLFPEGTSDEEMAFGNLKWIIRELKN